MRRLLAARAKGDRLRPAAGEGVEAAELRPARINGELQSLPGESNDRPPCHTGLEGCWTFRAPSFWGDFLGSISGM